VRTVSLADAVTLQRGFDLPVSQRRSGKYPVVTSNGMATTHNEFKVKGPGVVIGRSGSIGGGQYIEDDFWPLNTTLWVKDFKGNNEKYMYYLFRSLDFSGFNAGAAVPTLNRNHLSALNVQLPGRDKQDKIADILGTIDEKIELNRKVNETLEQMGQALFRHYFIDNPDAGKWKDGVLVDIIELNPRESIAKSTEAAYLEMKNMPEVGMSVKTTARRKFTSGMKFKNGDTLLARITPCLENGKTALVDFLNDDEVGFGSTEYIVMRPKQNTLTEYTYFLARSEAFRAFAIQSMVGTSGRQRVQNDSLATYKICTPDTKLLAQFHEKMQGTFAQIRSNSQQIQTLTTLRDTLLPRLISGKVKV